VDKLKLLLALPATRKCFLAILASIIIAVLVMVNTRLGLGFTDVEIAAMAGSIAAVFGSVILGIAIEDHGKSTATKPETPKDDPPKPKSMGFGALVPALLVVLCFSGCGMFTLHKRDEATIAAIKTTIEHRVSDFNMWKNELQVATPTARNLAGLAALNESEIDRLKQVLAYEEAKVNE